MSLIFSIRLTSEERDRIQIQADKLGYKSSSDFARELIKKGLQSLELSHKEEHLLCNSAQSLLLLREVVSLLSGNEEQSSHLINSAKNTAEEWKNGFKKMISTAS